MTYIADPRKQRSLENQEGHADYGLPTVAHPRKQRSLENEEGHADNGLYRRPKETEITREGGRTPQRLTHRDCHPSLGWTGSLALSGWRWSRL